MPSTPSPAYRFAQTFAKGLLLLGALVAFFSLPMIYIGLAAATFLGFVLASWFGQLYLSVDAWMMVPASWGAAIGAIAFASYVQRAQGGFGPGWLVTIMLGMFAVGVLAADRAGYDFRGRRATSH